MKIKLDDFDIYKLNVNVGEPFDKQTWNITLIKGKSTAMQIIKFRGFSLQRDKNSFDYIIHYSVKENIKPKIFESENLPVDYKDLIDDIQEKINNDKIGYNIITPKQRMENRKKLDEEEKKIRDEEWSKRPWYKKIVAPSD